MSKYLRSLALAGPTLGILSWTAVQSLQAYPGPVAGTAPVRGPTVQEATEVPTGSYSVSSRTGAAQYTFPIAVPPGRGGMQPSLSLAYSSQNPIRGGIAAGWTMPIAMIRVDTSRGRIGGVHYASSLAGGERLIPVDEPNTDAGVQTYRVAEGDSSYTRYEKHHVAGTPGYWVARTPDGITYYFGETSASRDEPRADSHGTEGRWFVTRVVDRAGNQVEYAYRKVVGISGGSYRPVDIGLDEILYTSNDAAGLVPHARVKFLRDWGAPALCGGSVVPIGAQFDLRTGIHIYEGAAKLRGIQVQVADASGWKTRREITLRYDADAGRCDAAHGPMRVIEAIEETAISAEGHETKLPPVTFDYSRYEHDFGVKKSAGEVVSYGDTTSHGPVGPSLGRGKRALNPEKPGGYPTVEKMMIDLDGDGRLDVLASRPGEGGACEYDWRRNLGDGQFAEPVSRALPTLPLWANGATRDAEREGCSLSLQFTQRHNMEHGEKRCGYPANYVGYHIMDVNEDGLPDIVTTLEYQRGRYRPNKDAGFASARAALSSMSPAPACMKGDGTRVPCVLDRYFLLPDVVPYVWTDDGIGGDSPRGDNCCNAPPGFTCPGLNCCSPSHCPGDFSPVVGSLWDPPVLGTGEPLPDWAGDTDGDWAWAGVTQMLSGDNSEYGGLRTGSVCGHFPEMHEDWYVLRVFYNRGDGEFEREGRLRLWPVPLHSERPNGTLELIGQGLASAGAYQGTTDIDGDGHVDQLFLHPPSLKHATGPSWGGELFVFRGRPDGSFAEEPYLWPFPPDGRTQPGRLIQFSRPGIYYVGEEPTDEAQRYFDTQVTLLDINGDGLPDYVDARPHPETGEVALRVYYNTGTGFESRAQGTVLSPELDATERQLSYAFSKRPDNDYLQVGYDIVQRRLLDIDQDGLVDLIEVKPPGVGDRNPWATTYKPGEPEVRLYMNRGDRFVPVTANDTLQSLRSAFARIKLMDRRDWVIKSDIIDIDGDGLLDAYVNDYPECSPNMQISRPWLNCGQTDEIWTDSDAHQGMRLLEKVDTGRGKTIEFTYAPSGQYGPNAAVKAAYGYRVPSALRVVEQVAVWVHGSGTARTTYSYHDPVYNRDRWGDYGFRGFRHVTITGPKNLSRLQSVTQEQYAYDVDPTGRLAAVIQRAHLSGEDADGDGRYEVRHLMVTSVESSRWQKFSLFDGQVVTYHKVEDRSWTCESNAPCTATGRCT